MANQGGSYVGLPDAFGSGNVLPEARMRGAALSIGDIATSEGLAIGDFRMNGGTFVPVGSLGEDAGYDAGYLAGFAAGLAANAGPPPGPDPVPVPISYADEPPVDHVAGALARLLNQYQDD